MLQSIVHCREDYRAVLSEFLADSEGATDISKQ